MKGQPLKHYHPLLQKEQHLESVVWNILPKEIADSVCQGGSRLAHLYGLPKTQKQKLSMRLILSATGTYNYSLAKWLDEKLKPRSVNRYTIPDTFYFAEKIQNLTSTRMTYWYPMPSRLCLRTCRFKKPSKSSLKRRS